MTNSIAIISLLVTNMATLDVMQPETSVHGELGIKIARKEIGIVFSNQVARTTITNGKGTNVHDVLLSSEVVGCTLKLRDPLSIALGYTNMMMPTNWFIVR